MKLYIGISICTKFIFHRVHINIYRVHVVVYSYVGHFNTMSVYKPFPFARLFHTESLYLIYRAFQSVENDHIKQKIKLLSLEYVKCSLVHINKENLG